MKTLLKTGLMFAVVAILCVALSGTSQAAPPQGIGNAVSINALAYHCHGGWGYHGGYHGGYYGGYHGGYHGYHGGYHGGWGGHGCHW